jgi:hypothetical protein
MTIVFMYYAAEDRKNISSPTLYTEIIIIKAGQAQRVSNYHPPNGSPRFRIEFKKITLLSVQNSECTS